MRQKIQGNDAFQRINYLYQISKAMASKNTILSSYYGNLVVNIAKKNVLKIHPEVKRQICKKCRSILIENVSTNMKIRNHNKLKRIEWKCNICGERKGLPAEKNKDHRVWVEKEEAVVEIIK
ncbi:uncharacterized protein LOC101735312 [Bombyx mori]|uniref:Uncharacterized protein n=2 Tax=Bombyx mori TaxID=7091 RepID=A0A8R1WIL5_BOMMO|nr:ribonuclease P protein subunit rpr2 isoform X1 [Bombyx mori]